MTDSDLHTRRLRLRPLGPADGDTMHRSYGDHETLRNWPRTYTRSEVASLLIRKERHHRQHGYGVWAMILRTTGEHIGNCGLLARRIGGWPVPELTYVVHRDHWGHGYATEAAMACRDHAFTRLGATRVIARIMYENTASRRLAARLGMRPAGWTTLIAGIPHIVYEMTVNDAPESRPRLPAGRR